jgi:hypothetical protein
LWCWVQVAALAFVLGACSTTSPQQRTADAEISSLEPLKQHYPSVVMGFDVQHDTTLVVSLDLQSYIGMDDDAVEALKHEALTGWVAVWSSAHPRAHGTLHVRFIDFIGRKVAEESRTI